MYIIINHLPTEEFLKAVASESYSKNCYILIIDLYILYIYYLFKYDLCGKYLLIKTVRYILLCICAPLIHCPPSAVYFVCFSN